MLQDSHPELVVYPTSVLGGRILSDGFEMFISDKRSKGCLTRDTMLHMMFKLGQCAEKKWRRLRGFDYLAKVVTGIKFKDGVEVTVVDQVVA